MNKQTVCAPTYTNSYILCPFSLSYDMWHHILWEFNTQLENLHSIKVGNQNCIRKKEQSVKLFNRLLTYIKVEADNSKKFEFILQNFYMKIHFTLWMNILNFNKVKYLYI